MYSNFKSFTELEVGRDEKRKAQKLILENAKRKYEANEAKRERAKLQGEGTWMLDSVSQRISMEEKDFSKAKKKLKKAKKKKKKKGKNSSSSSDSEKEEWVEADTTKQVTALVKGPQLQRESWMEAPLDFLPTTSRQDIRAAINKNKEEARKAAQKASEPGQHSQELNPYWKDGGTGLPQESKSSPAHALPPSSAGDGGFSWLQKAYARCVQQASDEGKTLEEVAAQRYGSLKNLEKMLAEAKNKLRFPEGHRTMLEKAATRSSGSSERNNRLERRRDRSESGDRRVGRNDSRERSRSKDRRVRRSDSRERRRERSRSKDRRVGRNDSRERRREKSRSKERQGGERNESKDSRKRSPEEIESAKDRKWKFRSPEEGEGAEKSAEFPRNSHRDESHGHRRAGFMRPGDSTGREESRSGSRETRPRRRSPDRVEPRWRKSGDKAAQQKPEQVHGTETTPKQHERHPGERERQHKLEKTGKKQRSSSSSSSGSDDSSAGSDSSTCDQEDDKPGKSVEQPPKVLTEEELNDLAAKILRAEIMGDEDLAAELKSKLEAARNQRAVSTPGSEFSHRRRLQKKVPGEQEEDNVVVLSRTSKGGMVRPVLDSASEHWGGKSSKKRKKTVSTHDSAGERSIYFDDDNKFDLKTLVEQEKSGTAEDQNAMFSRLAGRSTDRDLDVDDMFVSKAARTQDGEKLANRDRAAAILEHRKVSAAMEKCGRCFEKVPKHLIIAIGTKSYLCLPPHRSLTEGHCLIVPMQHSSSCTTIDEDVWREMQLFRKSLVQMFLAQDEDVVVMETVMHLKRFPHTALECIPLEKEVGDLAPIYFKKAIQEAGPEWADNKKLHSLREKDVRRVIPKGFPYFSVDFGLEGGFATVIEDEETFPSYFGREVVGGMIDAEPGLWRKPHKQSFEDQRQKVLKFEQKWRQFDWTRSLNS